MTPTPTSSFASYVPNLIITRLVTDPTPITEALSENFAAAVLYADISGFTPLTEHLAERGPAGAEILTRELNAYFGKIIDIIYHHGGDIVKFAGDALTAIWPAADGDSDLSKATRQASGCAMAIQSDLKGHKTADDLPLALSIGVGTGDVVMAYVGGVFSRWEFLITGPPMNQASLAEVEAGPGEVVLSSQAWALVQSGSEGEPLSIGNVRMTAMSEAAEPGEISFQNLPTEIQGSLRAYIPGAILNRLEAGQDGWLAELRRVTVLFVNLPDLTYTTPLEEGHAAMKALQTALYRYEGSVNKISVDDKGVTLVAALGLPPFAHEDDPIRGIRAALEMQAALQALNLHCAIGVTTGRAFCGSVGNQTRREYTMIGDVVNLSSRLMQAAGRNPYGEGLPILCDEPTYQATRNDIPLDRLPLIKVKGKAADIPVFRPSIDAHAPELNTVIRKSEFDIVGRTTERAALSDSLQAVRGGSSGVVIIEGDAGIGKSRLVEELQRQTREMNVTTLLGAGDAIEKNTAYRAWRFVFWDYFDLNTLIGDPIQNLERLSENQCNRLVSQVNSILPDLVHLNPLLNAVLPLGLPDSELTAQMSGEVRADNINRLLLGLLEAKAKIEPLLIVLEDAHWLDSASWALARLASRDVSPLLLVIVTRPLYEPIPAEYTHLRNVLNCRHLSLTALPPAEMLELVCQLLGIDTLPEEVGNLLMEKAEGNPFFSEELAYALRDNGILEISDVGARINPAAGDLNSLDFPDTIDSVITSRIDLLSPQQQLTLKVASVIGRIFVFQTLKAIYPIENDRPHLPNYLDVLERLDLTLLEAPEPELSYSFKHIITQEVAYNLMPFAQRRQLHRSVAEWLEQIYADNMDPFYALLAYHWQHVLDEQDPNPEIASKAIDYFAKAGEQALNNFASEAVEHYTHALEIARRTEISSEELTCLYTSLGRALELKSQFSRALATYKEMEKLAQERNDRPLKLGSLIAQVTLYGTPTPLHDPDRGKALGQQALTLARDLGNQAAESRLLWILSNTCVWTSNMSQAIDYGERSLALARQLNLREQMAYTLKDLAFNCYATIGDLDQAQPALREASNLWRELGNLPMLTDSLAAACYNCLHTGEYDQALAFSEEAFQLSQSIGSLWGQSNSLLGVGRAYWERGQPDRGLAVMEDGLRLSELSGFYVPQILTRADLATIYGGLGAIESGLETAHSALAMAEAQIPVFRPYVLGVLAQLQLLNGNLAEAEAVIDQGINDPNREVWLAYSLSVYLANCELPLRQGDYEWAMTITDTFLTDFGQFRAHIPQILYFQGQALLGLGQDNVALDRLREARTEAESLNARRPLWRILFALGQLEADPTEAERLCQQAREIIEYIADRAPTDLRVSFLDLPDVREVLDR